MKTIFIKKLFINLFEAIKLSYSFFSLSLEKKISKILTANNLTLSVAESCTGGLISSRLTDVSGSSDFIKENFITYANEAKVRYLGIFTASIDEFGVVSDEIASQMASGLLRTTSCDIALSTTGIAGPLGGSDKKPVGLLYIGVGNAAKIKTLKYNANELLSRKIIKYKFSQAALEHLYRFLKENYKGEI